MIKILDKYAFFYTEWPSNFKDTSFTWEAFGESHLFFCTEQAFMWAKAMFFGDRDAAKEILKPKSEGNNPMWCKQCGRWVENYDDSLWSLVRYSIMLEVNMCKYTQDKELKAKLLDPQFDGKTFVEASPTDKIWGIGYGMNADDDKLVDEAHWPGQNLLGKVITSVRKTLISDNAKNSKDGSVKKRYLTWHIIEDKVEELAAFVNDKYKCKFDAVVSIGRGGMVPARLLAEKFDIHTAYIIDAKAYDENDKLGEVKVSDICINENVHNVLVVDDVIFTGTTLNAALNKINANSQIQIALPVFLYENASINTKNINSNYIAAEKYDGDTTWLVFPWEY